MIIALDSVVETCIMILISIWLLSLFGHANPITYLPEPNKIVDPPKSVSDQVTMTFKENRAEQVISELLIPRMKELK